MASEPLISFTIHRLRVAPIIRPLYHLVITYSPPEWFKMRVMAWRAITGRRYHATAVHEELQRRRGRRGVQRPRLGRLLVVVAQVEIKSKT